jgi:flagellar biosynthesis/type III secretory pathway chaperone
VEHEERLLIELETATKLFITQYQGEIIQKTVGMTVKEKSSTLKDLAAVRAQRIALERQSHNIKDDYEPNKDLSGDKTWTIKCVGPKDSL